MDNNINQETLDLLQDFNMEISESNIQILNINKNILTFLQYIYLTTLDVPQYIPQPTVPQHSSQHIPPMNLRKLPRPNLLCEFKPFEIQKPPTTLTHLYFDKPEHFKLWIVPYLYMVSIDPTKPIEDYRTFITQKETYLNIIKNTPWKDLTDLQLSPDMFSVINNHLWFRWGGYQDCLSLKDALYLFVKIPVRAPKLSIHFQILIENLIKRNSSI